MRGLGRPMVQGWEGEVTVRRRMKGRQAGDTFNCIL